MMDFIGPIRSVVSRWTGEVVLIESSRMRIHRLHGDRAQEEIKKYKYDYTRGWKAGWRGRMMDAGPEQNDYWADGFMDAAADRDKWHFLDCPDHDHY